MTKSNWGGSRAGAGRKKEDPVMVAARNPRAAQRQKIASQVQHGGPDRKAIVLARMNDAALPKGATDADWAYYFYIRDDQLVPAWLQHKDEILSRWINEHPGSRPSTWWLFDAPRITEIPPGYDSWVLKAAIQPRERRGGKGVPMGDGVMLATGAYCGMPTSWYSNWLIGYTSAGLQHFDPNDPPYFESQTEYLDRNNLFLPGETSRLIADEARPEFLPECFWPDLEK